jgi:hypothetical protein
VAREQGEDRAAEHAEEQQEPDAADRVLEARDRLAVLDVGERLAVRVPDHRRDAVPAHLVQAGSGRTEVHALGLRPDRGPVGVEDADHGATGGGGVDDLLGGDGDGAAADVVDRDVVLELGGREPHVAVEVGPHAADGDPLGGDREQAEDHEGEAGRSDGEAPADWQAVETLGDSSHVARNTYPEPRTV